MKLELIYPLKMVLISQVFGNVAPMYTNMGLKGHNGIDFIAVDGTPIYATHDGYASYQIDSGGGHGVVIVTDKEYDTENGTCLYKTIYWHMVDSLKDPRYKSPLEGKMGFTKVECGDLIGYADNTGMSTGSHLHFGLKPVAKGEDWGSFYNLQQGNGYAGAIDPAPFFNGFYEQDIIQLKNKLSLLQTLIKLWLQLKSLTKSA